MAEFLTETTIAEKYRIDSLLRSGELGDFYRGRHVFMDKPVTLKVLPARLAIDGTIREQFALEARAVSAFTDPHILGVSDFGSDENKLFYIVFEGFDGETLKRTITDNGQFSVERSLTIAEQAAKALAAAHENGLIHGALTPNSILSGGTAESPFIKLFDLEPKGTAGFRRSEERISANVAYLAPENFSGLRTVDERADIYSLGVILFQMLAGEVPFKGETPTDVMLKHAEDEPPQMSEFRTDVPKAVEAVIAKALKKHPDERYQTAAEMAADLRQALDASASSGGGLWKTAFIAIAGIALLASALIYGTSSKQTDPVTQLKPDANGVPVQPINPATGAEEMSLASMPNSLPGEMLPGDMAQPPGTLPGGDNFNPWATGAPPPGAPLPEYIPPGGQVYTIDPYTGSPFMPNDSGVILVPVPANTNTQPKTTETPKPPATNSNSQTPPEKTPAKTAPSPKTAEPKKTEDEKKPSADKPDGAAEPDPSN